MFGLIDGKSPSARKAYLGHGAPVMMADGRAANALLAEVLDQGGDILAHQVELEVAVAA
jgi:hypothetical protein